MEVLQRVHKVSTTYNIYSGTTETAHPATVVVYDEQQVVSH